ncbi:MAG: folate-binding protein YgfZ [Caulobacterales bacterium]|nr:folate-binding protein YgfZ [Caulobacterales bacterium]
MSETPTYAVLRDRALIAVSGPDWRSFLQGQLTQDVETLGPGTLRFGALLSPQGRLLFDLFVLGREGGCWLDVPAAGREALIARLTMYRLRAKAEIVAHPGHVIALWGAGQAEPGFAPDPRLPALGLRGYGDVEPPGVRGDATAYDLHRLTLGVPATADYGEDATYPIEANFDLLHGIDFQKGCFVGQETTSRMKRRGQIKSRMLPITFAGPPPAQGAEILNGELRAGVVLSGVPGRAMALLRLDRAEGGSLTVDGRAVVVDPSAWFEAAT